MNGVARFMIAIGCLALAGCGSDLPSEVPPDLMHVSAVRAKILSGADQVESGPAEAVPEPTGFATLRGVFTVDGNPPAPPALSISKDATVCAPGGKTVLSQKWVIDPATRGLANVVLFADKMEPSWIHESAQPGKTDEVLFDQKQCVFSTHVVAIQTSQSLKVLNSDPVSHNLMVGSYNGMIPSGSSDTYKPRSQDRQPMPMSCSIHNWMRAWMLVRDDGYFAVTAPDGSFEIPNLPAGVDVTLRVWQEQIGFVQDVTVEGQGKQKWSKGRLDLVLEPGQDRELRVSIDASAFSG